MEPAEIERELADVERELAQLHKIASDQALDLAEEIGTLEARAERLRDEQYRDPTPWQIVTLARHLGRPKLADYLAALVGEFTELHGDRAFGDDPAIVAGVGRLRGVPVVVVGHAKGKDTRENLARNFGMPHPEGYRKALRAMELAERFRLPVLTFIDTPGAYPGDRAEERGQAEAIARCIMATARLRTPIVVTITGEGGSGGALAIGVGDAILMLQYAYYSVISPEGCATILWRDAGRAQDAAAALRMTAPDLAALGVVDEIVPEPLGGAHRDPDAAIAAVGEAIGRHLDRLRAMDPAELVEARYRKFRQMGRLAERAPL